MIRPLASRLYSGLVSGSLFSGGLFSGRPLLCSVPLAALLGAAVLLAGCGKEDHPSPVPGPEKPPAEIDDSTSSLPPSSTTPSSLPPSSLPPSSTTPSSTTGGSAAREMPPAQSEPETVVVKPITPSELDKLIAQKSGKAVLVDYWATWCVPCREQFPHTVELSKKYSPEELAVIAVSMDENDEATLSDVKKFIASHNSRIEPYINANPADEKAYEGFKIQGGALPHYKVFDKQGQLVAQFGGDPAKPHSPEAIDEAVAKAVGK